jgi:hypothetical protein
MSVAGEGFEPSQTEPKSVVLPLDDPAIASAKITVMSKKKQEDIKKVKMGPPVRLGVKRYELTNAFTLNA